MASNKTEAVSVCKRQTHKHTHTHHNSRSHLSRFLFMSTENPGMKKEKAVNWKRYMSFELSSKKGGEKKKKEKKGRWKNKKKGKGSLFLQFISLKKTKTQVYD